MTPPSGDGDYRDDRALLHAHVDGDPAAFGVLFTRHRDRLWAVALRTTGEPEEAADALQDAMISAFRRAGSFRGDAAVTTWLHRVVVNACLDRMRRHAVRAADRLPDDLEEYAGRGSVVTSTTRDGGDQQPETADPADVTLAHERRDRLLAALATLPHEQRAALVLVDMEGYPVEDAAAILECATGTVKSRCSRGRARLAPLVADLLGGNPTGRSRVPSQNPSSPAAPGTPSTDPGGEPR